MVADTNQLDEDALSEDDDGAHEQGEKDRLHGANPCRVCLEFGDASNEGREGGLVDNHPEDKRNGLLYSAQKQSVLFDTRADDTNKELEDIGQEVGDDLHDPETEPDDLDPDPELLLVGAADGAGDCAGLREDDGNGQEERNGRDIDHVAGDDAVVEDLGVDSAHAVEGRLVLARPGRQRGSCARVDLGQASAAAVEHARLLSLFVLVRGRRVRGRVADDRLQGDVGGAVHGVGDAVEGLESVAGEAERPRGRRSGVSCHQGGSLGEGRGDRSCGRAGTQAGSSIAIRGWPAKNVRRALFTHDASVVVQWRGGNNSN